MTGTYFAGSRYRVTLFPEVDPATPKRVYYVRALDHAEAFKMALMIENVYERPAVRRERNFEEALIETLVGETDQVE